MQCVCLWIFFFTSFVALAAFSIMQSRMPGMHCRVYTRFFPVVFVRWKSGLFRWRIRKKTHCIDDVRDYTANRKKSFVFFLLDENAMNWSCNQCVSPFSQKKNCTEKGGKGKTRRDNELNNTKNENTMHVCCCRIRAFDSLFDFQQVH